MKIKYEGVFTESDKLNIDLAFINIKVKLLLYMDCPDILEKLFSGIILEGKEELAGPHYGFTNKFDPKRIQLQTGCIDQLLIYHEVMHFICLNSPKELNPAEILSRSVIRTINGRPVTAGHCRNMGYKTTKYTGYISVNYPDHQHPENTKDGSGKDPTEDVCDMFTSLIAGNIADNDAGVALKDWIISRIKDILAL